MHWIFFDLGSTLLDESAAVRIRIERTVEKLRGTTQETSLEAFTAMMERAARQDAHPYALVMGLLGGAQWEPWPKGLVYPYPGAKPLLEHLHGRCRLGVIANHATDTVQRCGFAPYLDVVVVSGEMGFGKPDPRMFTTALERAGCLPQEATMVGDRLDNDIAPAKRLGMKTIWIRQGWGGKAVPASEDMTPDRQVDTLEELGALLIQ